MNQVDGLQPLDTETLASPVATIVSDRETVRHILASPAFSDVEVYPHTGRFGRTYHAAVHGDTDSTFVACLDGCAILACLCAPLDRDLGFYSLPLQFFSRSGVDETMYRHAVGAAFTHIDELASRLGSTKISVRERITPHVSPIGEACLVRGAEAARLQHACVDLTAGHAAWRSALRKSSRSLINWGRRNLAMRFVNSVDSDRAPFDAAQQLHAEVSGRVTRSQSSWDIMYDFIASGHGELIVADLDGKPVGASLFIDGTETCVYAVGAYDRALFDKPLAHFSVWLGIERAHARGMKKLELGVVYEKGTVSDKEYQIGYFKRGFATAIEDMTVWSWSPSPQS